MGVEYSRFLIPAPSTLCPDAATVVRLINRLTEERWLPAYDSPALELLRYERPDENPKQTKSPAPFPLNLIPALARRFETEYLFQLPTFADAPRPITEGWLREVSSTGLVLQYDICDLTSDTLQYPLSRLDHPRQETYYAIRFLSSPDFVYYSSETLEGLQSTKCTCGHELAFEPLGDVFLCQHLPLCCPKCGRPFDPAEHDFRVNDPWTGESYDVKGGSIYRFAIEVDCGKCRPESPGGHFADGFRKLCSETLECDFVELETIS